jgi:DNA-binding NarL/FixJ family response regulator
LARALNRQKGLRVCGQTEPVAEALKAVAALTPDLVLLNLGRMGRGPVNVIRAIRSADRQTKLLVMAAQDEPRHAARALRAGADGYIIEQEDTEEVVQAIRDVLDGLIYVSEQVVSGTPSDAAPTDTLPDKTAATKQSGL